MLHNNTKALRELQDGCRRLGLPNSAATALVGFLQTKRAHDQFLDQSTGLRMSAGGAVEQLSCWMLLNTQGVCGPHGVPVHDCHLSEHTFTRIHLPCLCLSHTHTVSGLVHELVGGVVEHRSTDSTDLPADVQLLQCLYSINILRLEGLEPDINLWTVCVYCFYEGVQYRPVLILCAADCLCSSCTPATCDRLRC